MPLNVETGQGLADANSYVSFDEARSLASERGISLPSDDNALLVQLVNGADRIGAYEDLFSGRRKVAGQGLSFPRSKAEFYGSDLDSNSVPRNVKIAQIVLAGMLEAGLEIWTQQSDGITLEKIGPITTQYSESARDAVGNTVLPQIASLLTGFFSTPSVNFRVTR